MADACAVGTAEPAPLAFLGMAPGRKEPNRGNDPGQQTTQCNPPSRPTGWLTDASLVFAVQGQEWCWGQESASQPLDKPTF